MVLALTAALTGCGSDGDAATPTQPASLTPSSSPSASPTPTQEIAVGVERVDVNIACSHVQIALHAMQDDEVPSARRNAEAAGYLTKASDGLNDLVNKTVATTGLNTEIALIQVPLLTNPGTTPDVTGLREQYDLTCVQGLGLDPITPDN